jgi:hypothetical protein
MNNILGNYSMNNILGNYSMNNILGNYSMNNILPISIISNTWFKIFQVTIQ